MTKQDFLKLIGVEAIEDSRCHLSSNWVEPDWLALAAFADWLEENGDPLAETVRWMSEHQKFPYHRFRTDYTHAIKHTYTWFEDREIWQGKRPPYALIAGPTMPSTRYRNSLEEAIEVLHHLLKEDEELAAK